MKFYGLVVRIQLIITACGLSSVVLADQTIPNNVDITGIYVREGNNIKILNGGSILIQNSGLGNGNVNGLVELNGGTLDLGNGSTINALGGWGNPNLAGIALNGTASNSHFTANNL